MTDPRVYVLLDANLIAGYYARQTLGKKSLAADRIKLLIDAVKEGGRSDIKLLAPSICIAETFTVLSKYTRQNWKAKRTTPAIHGVTHKRILADFEEDTRMGKLIEPVHMQPDHLAAVHLIAPIDHNTRILKPNSGKTDYAPQLGGTD